MFFAATWNRRSQIELLEQLEMYVSSGLPMKAILAAAGEAFAGRRYKALSKIRATVEAGQTLGNALAMEVNLPLTITNVINCGESSGDLAIALKTAHDLLEKEQLLISAALGALIYPTVIFSATAALSLGLTQGVMPQITPILLGLHRELPLLTRVMVVFSDWLASYWLYASAILLVSLVAMMMLYRFYQPFRFGTQWLMLKVPFLGKAIKRHTLTLFFRTIGALVNAGVPVDSAYNQAAQDINVRPLRCILLDQAISLQQGIAISTMVFPGAPPYVSSLLACGHLGGQLGPALVRAADLLDLESAATFKKISVLVEPLMMLFLGGSVGLVALSIMLPIYDVSNAIQR